MATKPHRPDPMGFSGKPHPQYQDELQPFIQLLVDEGCDSYLEIGCRYGDTFHQVASAMPKGSKVVALDLPGAKSGMKNKGGHQDSFNYLQKAIHDLHSRGYDAHGILGDSHDAETVKRAQAFAPFDAILIDGDHTAAGVMADWTAYGPMGRLVAFHDIAGKGKWARQIRPIFDHLAAKHPSTTFISDGLRRGIGVIWRTR